MDTMSHFEVVEETEVNQEQIDDETLHLKDTGVGGSDSDDLDGYYSRRRSRPKQLYSEIWTKFTIVSRKHSIASCNICGSKLSFKTTTSNLKKHVERKHNYDITKSCVMPFQKYNDHRLSTAATGRPKLTDLGGLDGLILNVVGDDGDPPAEFVEEVVEQSEVQDQGHDYCLVDGEDHQEHTTKSNFTDPKPLNRNAKIKRSRIVDLQIECLELKKYTMQMESLLLERQLNLPRSIYTENLRGCDNVTRGTQTDVGGSNTKVFFVSDRQESGSMNRAQQHLFTFQARLQE